MTQRHAILATAGHIDHGKSSLVKALSGIDPDRLPEEKARGMTIDLGFAHLELSGSNLGIVDVPGHQDFVKNNPNHPYVLSVSNKRKQKFLNKTRKQ